MFRYRTNKDTKIKEKIEDAEMDYAQDEESKAQREQKTEGKKWWVKSQQTTQ